MGEGVSTVGEGDSRLGARRLGNVALGLLLLGAGACATRSHRHPGPSAPLPLVWIDTLPIVEPQATDGDDPARRVRELLTEQTSHELSIARRISGMPPALNVDAFDQVAPSTWFEPRITAGALSPEEVGRGPPIRGPDLDAPLRVVEGKVEGVTSGFTVEDARGVRFLLKFDPPGMPGLGSGADVVSSRIFWAAGYNAPKDVVIRLRPASLVLAEDATVERGGAERAMTPRDVRDVLSGTDARPDGTIRALASRFVEGTPKGPFRFEGRRRDDANDYHPHEDRRELRGIWVLASWVNHVDLRVQNTLDSFIEPGGYLRHYLIDFATTLGSGAIRPLNAREGEEFAFDPAASVGRLLSLGFYRVGWEGTEDEPLHPSLGWISSTTFAPAEWKPFIPNEAFRRVTPRDGYWGAKLVAAFTAEHVRAAIDQAEYPKHAAALLHEILMERRRRILAHWFGQVSPVEEVVARRAGASLRIELQDLGLEHGLWETDDTEYRWKLASRTGEQAADGSGRQTLTIPLDEQLIAALAGATTSEPVTLELEVARKDRAARPTHVRLANRGGGELFVSGLIH